MNETIDERTIKEIDDDGKLKRRYYNKVNNAKKEGLRCELSFEEYALLVKMAGLKSSDLGFTGNNYVLARIGDDGNYRFDNCRFITQKENVIEKKISQKAIESSRRNIMAFNKKPKDDTFRKNLNKKISDGIRNSEYYKTNRVISLIKNYYKRKNMDHRYCGENNSAFGTFWITNGVTNKKWKDEYGNVPDGFYRGRKMRTQAEQETPLVRLQPGPVAG